MVRCFRRPVYTGLSLFFLVVECFSQSLPVYDYTKSLLLYEPVNPRLIPSNTGLRLDYDFDPLLSEKGSSRNDNYNSFVTSNGLNVTCYTNTSHWKYYLSTVYSDLFAAWREDDQEYSFQTNRKECDLSGGFLYKGQKFSAGLGLGRLISSHLPLEHLSDISGDFTRYLKDSPWQFSADADYMINSVLFGLRMFSGPVHGSISELVTRDGGSFRSFPLYLIKRNISVETALNKQNFSSSLSAGITGFENADMLQYPNSMPLDIRITEYDFSNPGWVKTSFTDSLYWKFNGGIAGGWMAGYNFDRNRFTFFKADSLLFSFLQGSAGLTVPLEINCGLIGSYFTFSGPAGFLRLSAFSEWSVFEPLDYRFTNAGFDYYESGLYINRLFKWKRFEFKGDLTATYIKTKMSFSYAKKEIVVLLPVYDNPTFSEPFDSDILLLTPSLASSMHAGPLDLSLSILQRIPFLITKGNSGSIGNGSGGGTHGKSSFTGGTSVKMSVEWRR